jgi:hypothetical protein
MMRIVSVAVRMFERLRRNVRWVSCVGLLLMLPASVSAQSAGVQGGVSFATFKTDDPDVTTDSLVSPTGGLFIVFASDSFTGRADALYSVRGAKLGSGAKYQVTYLEVPLGAQMHFARHSDSDVHIFGGTSIGFKLDAKLSEGDIDVPIDDEVDDFDLGIFFGAGVTFGRFVVDGRYTHGVRNINTVANTASVKHRAFAVMFGFRLN